MSGGRDDFDVAVVGAGPVGCAAALAEARAGARVLLLEANPKASQRLAGEWLHPRGVAALRELGIDLGPLSPYDTGRGFVVHPDDGGSPIALPYAGSARGWSGEHAALVERLRAAAAEHAGVRYEPDARVTDVGEGELAFLRSGAPRRVVVRAGRVIGADGRKSRVRSALGLPSGRVTLSRMVGLRLRDACLPQEGYGHVFLGGPGPMLAYRIAPDALRLCLDVPLGEAAERPWLLTAYAPALPASLRPAFEEALRAGELSFALNQSRARSDYGRPALALVGDAAGFQHPLTAVGMTLGLRDAVERAREPDFARWQSARRRDARVPELLAGGLYDAFSSESDAARAVRQGMYALWRRSPRARTRSMRYLGAEAGQLVSFSLTFLRISATALLGLVAGRLRQRDGRGAVRAVGEFWGRARWLVSGVLGRPQAPTAEETPAAVPAVAASAELALERGIRALLAEQREDGRWEGEVIWCPMLAAQYVLFAEALGLKLSAERRGRLLRHFERTQLESGLWGLHAVSEPYLFTTALVYVAARLLGEAPSSPLLSRARTFIQREDVLAIPSWGKLWLALVGLHSWDGVPPLLPELWALPRWLPIHPSRYYCHTRQIYLAMSALYARRPVAPDSDRLAEIRSELHPMGAECVNWRAARFRLRAAELVTPPSAPLRVAYRLFALYERHHSRALRQRVLRELEARMGFELRSTDYTALSPVSGLLSILALHAGGGADDDVARALERLDAWMWSDERDGLRISGARSATWDTSFALQALAQAKAVPALENATARGSDFLRRQQIRQTPDGFRSAFRLDPRGGFCFAGVWHGWPVSDCTAEAMDALAGVDSHRFGRSEQAEAARFVLRCQNADGGFGSYEARRSRVGLEWLNPAEMFGESMTEHSYVECTASCLAALSGLRRRFPELLGDELPRAIQRAERRLRRLQRPDGSWRGVWGVQFVYGTLFGVRGLLAAGAAPDDPAVRRACAWLRERQRDDGGWGEHHSGCGSARYVPHPHSQVVQTAWALMALLEAQDPDWDAVERGARFLMAAQRENGTWPQQDPTGLFFRTALLEYELYRSYFPVWALALYETRRRRALCSLERPS